MVPALLVSAEQGVLADVPRQVRPPPVSLLPARRVLGFGVVLFQLRLSVESRLPRAEKGWLELWSFRIELRVWISLGPGLRAYPPSASDFPAAAE